MITDERRRETRFYEGIGSSREYICQIKSFGCQPILKTPQPCYSKPYVRSCLALSSPAPVYSLGFSLFSTPTCQQPFSSSHTTSHNPAHPLLRRARIRGWWAIICCHSCLPVAFLFLFLRLRLRLSACGRFEDATSCSHSGRYGGLFGFANLHLGRGKWKSGGGAGGDHCGVRRDKFVDGVCMH